MVRRILVATVLAVLTAPVAAHAATSVQAGTLNTPQGPQMVVLVADDNTSAPDIDAAVGIEPNSGDPAVAISNSAGISSPNDSCNEPSTTLVICFGTFDALVISGNGGNDKITVDQIADGVDPLYAELYGDAGIDTITATPDNQDVPQPETFIDGGPDSDKIISGNGPDELHGGDGNDTMESRQGEDTVRGEGGDDSVSAGTEEPAANVADTVDGGPGFDSIPNSGDYNRGIDDDVSVTVDGVANDGEPGEGDNVIAVEQIYIEADHANYVGTNAGDDVFVDAASSTIRGLGGDDKLVAYDGNDTIEGGDGNDYLEGGFGNDVLDGGGGVDRFHGDRNESNVIAVGRDQILARDGNAETIDCGIGPDTAQVDATDAVSNCETVDRPQVGPPTVIDGSVLFRPGAPKVVGKRTIRRIASKGLVVMVACPAACTVKAELRVDKKTARKLRLGKARVLARGKKTLRSAGTARVTLKVVRKARKRFRKLRRATVTLRTGTEIDGTTTRTSRKLKLKR